MRVVAELDEYRSDDEDDDDGGGDEPDSGDCAAKDACGFIADIGGHVDAEGAGRRFADRDHVSELVQGEPSGALAHVGQEWDGRKAAADREQSDKKEFYEQLEIDHVVACESDETWEMFSF